ANYSIVYFSYFVNMHFWILLSMGWIKTPPAAWKHRTAAAFVAVFLVGSPLPERKEPAPGEHWEAVPACTPTRCCGRSPYPWAAQCSPPFPASAGCGPG